MGGGGGGTDSRARRSLSPAAMTTIQSLLTTMADAVEANEAAEPSATIRAKHKVTAQLPTVPSKRSPTEIVNKAKNDNQ